VIEGNLMTARDVAIACKFNGLIWRRWLGMWIDFGVCLGILLLVEQAYGPRMSEQGWLTAIGLMLTYFIVMEAGLGWTIGKLVTDTRVVNKMGRRPNLIQAIIRTLFRLLEANPLAAGGIFAGTAVAWSKAKQRLGDMAAGTYVLRRSDLARLNDTNDSSVGGHAFTQASR
jgi:uncharacterized RDD family membrane protein YckC